MIVLERFVQTKIFKTIITDPELIMVFLSGSRLLNYVEEKSDYDIVLLYRNKRPDELLDNLSLQFDEKNIHWYRKSLKEFLTDSEDAAHGASIFEKLLPEKILWSNLKLQKYVDLLFQEKNAISALARYNLYQNNKNLLQYLISKQELSSLDLKKPLYKFLLLAYRELGLVENEELCWKIKLSRQKYVEKKDRLEIQNILKRCIQKMENDGYSASQEETRLLLLFQELETAQ